MSNQIHRKTCSKQFFLVLKFSIRTFQFFRNIIAQPSSVKYEFLNNESKKETLNRN